MLCLTLVIPWTVACQAPLSMGILQVRILEQVAISFSRGSPWPRNWTQVSWIAGRFFTDWATREALSTQQEIKNSRYGISLVVQWLRLHPPMQRTGVQSLVRNWLHMPCVKRFHVSQWRSWVLELRPGTAWMLNLALKKNGKIIFILMFQACVRMPLLRYFIEDRTELMDVSWPAECHVAASAET